jgi:nitroreductase
MREAIEKRVSVRSYLKKALSVTDMTKVTEILEFVEAKKGPFSHQVKFFFVDNNQDGKKIGTYGFIKNPPTFIGGVVENTLEGLVDFGFLFEEVILRLTSEGFGTVWLGGTFDRTDFDVEVKEGEVIACVSPVGYSADKSIREKVVRKFAKADQRIPFDELFFLGKELQKVNRNHPYYHILRAVQIAPSASNKQPWRIVFEDDAFHLYLKRTKGYGNLMKMDIQAVDIGIALSHLVLSLNEDGQGVEYIVKKPFDMQDCLYILSVKIHGASTS